MRAGCLASLVLWLIVGSLVLNSLVPIATGLVLIVGWFALRGLDSERPLY